MSYLSCNRSWNGIGPMFENVRCKIRCENVVAQHLFTGELVPRIYIAGSVNDAR